MGHACVVGPARVDAHTMVFFLISGVKKIVERSRVHSEKLQ